MYNCRIISLDSCLFCWVPFFIIIGNIITIIAFWKLSSFKKKLLPFDIPTNSWYYCWFRRVIELLSRNILILITNEETKRARCIAVDVFSGAFSIMSLLLIAVQRFFAIVFFPFGHRVLTKRMYAYVVLITVITTMTEFLSNSVFASVFRLIFASFTVICLIGKCFLYTVIYVYARRENPRLPRKKHEQNKKLAKTLFIITMLTLITWIPLVYWYRMRELCTVLKRNYCKCRWIFHRSTGVYQQLSWSFNVPLAINKRLKLNGLAKFSSR